MRTALARAKVNLFLSVTGQRQDGLHNLESLCVFAPIGDGVTLSLLDVSATGLDVSFDLSGPYAADLAAVARENNLITRAAQLLYETATQRAKIQPAATGRRADHPVGRIHVQLEKNLPLASGLGGGTSDAVTVLYLLNDLWQVGLSARELMTLAFGIGADGPICLWPHLYGNDPVYGNDLARHDCEDIQHHADRPERIPSASFVNAGETVKAGPGLPPFAMVLANPGLSVPTKDVFDIYAGRALKDTISHDINPDASLDGSDSEAGSGMQNDRRSRAARRPEKPDILTRADIGRFAEFIDLLKGYTNDLEEPACICAPALVELGGILAKMPGCALARMTGSGATYFGLFECYDLARQAAATLSRSHNIWAVPCEFGNAT